MIKYNLTIVSNNQAVKPGNTFNKIKKKLFKIYKLHFFLKIKKNCSETICKNIFLRFIQEYQILSSSSNHPFQAFLVSKTYIFIHVKKIFFFSSFPYSDRTNDGDWKGNRKNIRTQKINSKQLVNKALKGQLKLNHFIDTWDT